MESVKKPKTNSVNNDKETVIKVLEYILDTCMVNQEQSSIPSFGKGKHILFVSQEEIPSLEGQDTVFKITSLLSQRCVQELDRIRHCIIVYNRSCDPHQKHAAWDKKIWLTLSSATKQAIATTIVQILVEATSSHGSHDLFSAYEGTSGTHGDLSTFMDCISGWSSDGAILSPWLLSEIMKQAKLLPEGKKAVIELIKSSMRDIKAIKRPDEILSEGAKTFDSLQTILVENSIIEMLGERLLVEVMEATKGRGDYFEKESVLGPLLSISTILPSVNPLFLRSSQYTCFTSLRGFPTPFAGDVEQCQSGIQEGFHKIHTLLHAAILQQLKCSSVKNNILSWMAAVVSLNELRAGPKFELKKAPQLVASDGFLVNFCSVLLEFCKPFFSTHPSAPKLPLINPDYPVSPLCRLDLHNEPCLASGIILTPDRMSLSYERFLCLGGNFKFVAECFFITLRALHVGILPATETFMKGLGDIGKELDRKGGEDKILKDLYGLFLCGGSCCLLDPKLVQQCSEFYITLAVWITRLMETCYETALPESEVHKRQQKTFSSVPEHGVKDMVKWFLFILRTKPKLLQGLQLTPLVDCCISLLERPDLLPGPVAQSLIISMLLACVGRDSGSPQQLLSVRSWGNILGELSAMVQGSPAFQSRLGPALLHTYSAVGVFEGLDVDKENFDKYSARYDIAQLLLYLWSRIDCRESIIRQTGTRKFESFLGAIFDTLLYQLNDSLHRIANIHRMELEKENASVWGSLSAEEKHRKESLFTGEQRAAKILLLMGKTLLELLVSVTEVESVAKHFCNPPLSIRTAAAMMGFLDLLCGARQSELRVTEPEKFGFEPRKLVSDIATVIAHIWHLEKVNGVLKEDGFTNSLAAHPDYSRSAMLKVNSVLQRHQLCSPDVISDYASFLEKLDEVTGTPGDPLAQASQVIGQGSMSLPPGTVAEWQREAESVQIDVQSTQEVYIGALQDSKYDSATLQGVHTLEDKAVATLDPRSPRVRAILRDVKQLEESLPIHPDSSVFVRQDEERMDLVRVLITGPVDTPYNYGCFVFDVSYPINYPVNPPLVVMTTTGNGTIRFNPNLYADGKVCLSLLGTWHGGDSSEKWDPVRSNLMQVLVSIQGLILIPEPIYNEPGYEAMQGTPQGTNRSAQYNAYIQINTIRYAMLEQLRHPPVGFEDTIKIHFMFLKEAILKQCSKWLREAVSVDHEQKLRKAIDELRAEFDNL